MTSRLTTTLPPTRKEVTMNYKTITLWLLEQNPELHERLRSQWQLLKTMERLAEELKVMHDDWKAQLRRRRPESDESQIASEALEIAVSEMEDYLRCASVPEDTETLPLAGAIAFVHSHMPPA
jgi:hypothetical protein